MKIDVRRHGGAIEHGDPSSGNDARPPLTAQGIQRNKVRVHVNQIL